MNHSLKKSSLSQRSSKSFKNIISKHINHQDYCQGAYDIHSIKRKSIQNKNKQCKASPKASDLIQAYMAHSIKKVEEQKKSKRKTTLISKKASNSRQLGKNLSGKKLSKESLLSAEKCLKFNRPTINDNGLVVTKKLDKNYLKVSHDYKHKRHLSGQQHYSNHQSKKNKGGKHKKQKKHQKQIKSVHRQSHPIISMAYNMFDCDIIHCTKYEHNPLKWKNTPIIGPIKTKYEVMNQIIDILIIICIKLRIRLQIYWLTIIMLFEGKELKLNNNIVNIILANLLVSNKFYKYRTQQIMLQIKSQRFNKIINTILPTFTNNPISITSILSQQTTILNNIPLSPPQIQYNIYTEWNKYISLHNYQFTLIEQTLTLLNKLYIHSSKFIYNTQFNIPQIFLSIFYVIMKINAELYYLNHQGLSTKFQDALDKYYNGLCNNSNLLFDDPHQFNKIYIGFLNAFQIGFLRILGAAQMVKSVFNHHAKIDQAEAPTGISDNIKLQDC